MHAVCDVRPADGASAASHGAPWTVTSTVARQLRVDDPVAFDPDALRLITNEQMIGK